jgi:hypothetical protein
LLAFLQCPKRLWLEVYSPNLRIDSRATKNSLSVGHEVGRIARQVYDPEAKGALIDPLEEGFDEAIARTQSLLKLDKPIFEAGFISGGAMAFADVMLPVKEMGKASWRIVEVKSSGSVKEYHRQDAAIQAFVARESGVFLSSIAIAHINSSWTYPGAGDYAGLLVEQDLTDEAFDRSEEVRGWIREAQQIITRQQEPPIRTGKQCVKPFPCGFLDHCESQEPISAQPIKWLPGPLGKGLRAYVEANNINELSEVPDKLLNDKQRRVKTATVSGKPYYDKVATKEALSNYKLPAYFLDFETINFPVPIWAGTRPYQQIPFQFSIHVLEREYKLEHYQFLDLSGHDPSLGFAESLISACGAAGPIFVYNSSFEATRVRELSYRFPGLDKQLQALNGRMVDLLPLVRRHYYHPNQKGSWSIKAVLPTIFPELNYENLSGVQDGGDAMAAFLEATASRTTKTRKAEIEQELLAYCAMDTLAMVRLWSSFSDTPIDFYSS